MRKSLLIGSLATLLTSSACEPGFRTTLGPEESTLSCEGEFCRTRDGKIRDMYLPGVSYIQREDTCYEGQVWGNQQYNVICPEDSGYESLARLDEFEL